MPSFKSILSLKSLPNALKASSSFSKAIHVISEPTFVRAATEIVLPDGTVLHDVTRAFHVADDARERARKLNKAKTAAIPPPSSSSGSSSIPASKPTILTGLGLVLWFEDKDEVKVDATVTVQKQSDSERVWWA